ncbi:tRNA preQ1(34) S-adenosylmethionine ribosyltransferase-isomerase QueA [Candidatus Woesearchaeota archaeon]|nr:MAG: tRNA preQ1(34) S-adenosylmethionine ribosyltransferase-isomerase QueA [Candidatus Woesearchaeota archaeon]
MKLSLFDYELPKHLIAQNPADRRDNSKLLVASQSGVFHRRFSELPEFLEPGDVLVFNESKVLKAQIDARKETGGKVSVMVAGKSSHGENVFLCKIKGSGVRPGSALQFPGGIVAKVVRAEGTDFFLDFGEANVSEMLENHGRLPLPPYIKKTPRDLSRYQTVYARNPGSLAAPTAGLHFTPQLLDRLSGKGVLFARVTLHVSFGTFNPVREEEIEKHKMDPEFYTVSEEAARIINNRKGRLIAVGTTSLKTLESAADESGRILPKSDWSDLFIYPGYKFKSGADGMITNFHLPKSTLLMLVSAFYGRERILELYRTAIEKEYRFFSFGDAMLLLK